MIVEKNSSINNSLAISSRCKYLLTLESENDFDELKDFLSDNNDDLKLPSNPYFSFLFIKSICAQ